MREMIAHRTAQKLASGEYWMITVTKEENETNFVILAYDPAQAEVTERLEVPQQVYLDWTKRYDPTELWRQVVLKEITWR